MEGQLGAGGYSFARWPGGQASVSDMPAAISYLGQRPLLYERFVAQCDMVVWSTPSSLKLEFN